MKHFSMNSQWQCVMVCWGDKYPVELINHLMHEIARHAASPPRFVLICDCPNPVCEKVPSPLTFRLLS